MPVIILTLLLSTVLLGGTGNISASSFKAVETVSYGWKEMKVNAGEIRRTSIAVLNTAGSDNLLEITLKNAGQKSLLNFPDWDVVVRYKDLLDNYYEKWLPYTSSALETNEWTVKGIYKTAQTEDEAFQPNILNPQEELVIQLKLSPAPKLLEDHLATIVTPNGISVTTTFRFV